MQRRPARRNITIGTHRFNPAVVGARPLVVIPTYRERENVAQLIPAVLGYPGFEVLVVDDGSPDGTADAVRAVAADNPGRVHLLERPAKLGLGTAYLAGFAWALQRDYTHIFEMDADFSHHPAALPRLLQASREADLVIGSRYVPGGRTVNWSPLRKLISRGGSLYARLLLGLPVSDLTGGFKCFRRHVLDSLDLSGVSSTGYAFQIELTYRAAVAGFRVTEIPITFAERRHGTSKMSARIVLEAVQKVVQLRLEHGLAAPALPVPAAVTADVPRRRVGGSPGL